MMEITWNREKMTWKVQKMLCWKMIAEIKWMLLTVVFVGKDKTQWGTVKKFYTHSMQLARYSDKVTWGYRPNEEQHYTLRNMELSGADEIKDNIFQQTNRYILIIQPTFSHDSDAKFTDKIEIKAFICLLFLAGALRSK
jgi:hypothetical protein